MGTHYVGGKADGSTLSRVVVATSNYAHRRLISDETQANHEGIPGHELQVTIQQHLKGLPAFRSEVQNNAYAEGWAVYAEALGKEIGFFQDPASDYGLLNLELMRAVRLRCGHWYPRRWMDPRPSGFLFSREWRGGRTDYSG